MASQADGFSEDQPNRIAVEEQVQPHGQGVDVATLVHKDIEDRISMGAKKYGERLTTNNGRDALMDAYQEVLDLAVYLRQMIWERENPQELHNDY